ncbi:MAG: hypothetical protein Kow00120_14280 [Anaerolineae bacterium]
MGCCGCLTVAILSAGVALAAVLGVALVLGSVYLGRLGERLEAGLEKLEQVDTQLFQSTRIYDRNGITLYEVFEEGRRTLVHIEDVPQNLIDATIATEDDSFWDNPGVDLQSIARGLLQLVQEGEIVSGASTITQQVVRQVAFEYEYRTAESWQRKLEEAFLAMLLNQRKTKSEILELYLNVSYYGNLAYGVEMAAQVYFGRPARDLSLAQATLLAGLPQAPGELDPLSPDPAVRQAVKDRQRVVLDLMVRHGYLSQEQADAAYNEVLVLQNPNVPLNAPHFTVYAQGELERLMEAIGQDPALIRSGGLEVFTSLDLRYQTLVEQVARQQVAAMRDAHNMTNAAVVVLHPPTGEILAMLGSVDFDDESIDGQVNVAISPRQPGSSVKPITYAAALEQGWTAANVLWDTPTEIDTGVGRYVPLNYDRTFHGPVRVRDALANSYNVPAVQTLRQVGIPNFLSMARRLGIRSLGTDPSLYGLSLTLGGGEITLLELTQVYAAFANEGNLTPSAAILCVLDSEGNILYEYEGRCPRGNATPTTVNATAERIPAMDPRVAFVVGDILADNAARTPAMGASSPLFTGDLPTSVKTGTSDDWRDNWTAGYTRNLAVGVWTGNSDGSQMVNVSGLQGAAPIWNQVMTGIYASQDLLAVLAREGHLSPDYRQPPPGMSRREVCRLSSLEDPATACTQTSIEWFLDSPVAVPQPDGSLIAPQPSPTPASTPDDPNAPLVTEVSYGVWVATVIPLPPELQAALAPQATQGPALPPPRYCIVPAGWKERPEVTPFVQQLWFIAPPPVREDEIRARQWAEERNIPVLPYLVCDDTVFAQVAGAGTGGIQAVWRITSPKPGDEVRGVVPIEGTAQFRTDEVQFYKIEIGQGVSPTQWVTLGETHGQPVVNGVLEYLHADALPTGDWVICLELVKWDGNFPTPSCVPIKIVR